MKLPLNKKFELIIGKSADIMNAYYDLQRTVEQYHVLIEADENSFAGRSKKVPSCLRSYKTLRKPRKNPRN